jgi:hypothetical protein
MDPTSSSRNVATIAVPRTIVLEKYRSRNAYIKRAVIESAIRLLPRTLLKRDEKLMILPRCILPLISETISHINARLTKNILCEGI